MKFKKASLAAAMAAVALSLATPAAFAANVLIVDGTSSPPADVATTASLVGNMSFVTDYAVSSSCSTAAVGGYVKRGASVTSGTKIGAITSAVFGTSSAYCTTWGGLSLPVVMAKTASPTEWGIYAASTPAKGATVVPVQIRNVGINMHSTGSLPWSCELGMVGTLPATFNQTTQRLTINTGASYPLAITAFDKSGTSTPDPSGITCGGEFYTGDNMAVTGTLQLATPGVGGIHF